MNVSEVMTTDVRICRPEDSLASCANMMRELNVGIAPVLDRDDNLVGVITDRDIAVRAVARGVDPNSARVAEFMTPDPITVSFDADVEEAADIMADAQVRRLPVVDDNGRLVGIVSLGDLAVDVGEEELLAETLEEISVPTR